MLLWKLLKTNLLQNKFEATVFIWINPRMMSGDIRVWSVMCYQQWCPATAVNGSNKVNHKIIIFQFFLNIYLYFYSIQSNFINHILIYTYLLVMRVILWWPKQWFLSYIVIAGNHISSTTLWCWRHEFLSYIVVQEASFSL